MSGDKFIVFNSGTGNKRGPVSLIIYKTIEKTDGMTVHNYKRALRSAFQSIVIPYATSVELVSLTGLTVEQLKNQGDLRRLIGARILKEMQEPVEEVKIEEVPLTTVDPQVEAEEKRVELEASLKQHFEPVIEERVDELEDLVDTSETYAEVPEMPVEEQETPTEVPEMSVEELQPVPEEKPENVVVKRGRGRPKKS